MIRPVRYRWEFELLWDTGRYRRSGPLGLRSTHEDADGSVRVAFAVGRGVGSAVVRNRVRRRLRAHVARLDREHRFAPGRYLIVASPDAATASFAELGAHLEQLTEPGAAA